MSISKSKNQIREFKAVHNRNKKEEETFELKKKQEKEERIKLLLEEQKKLLEQSNNDYINEILDKKKSIIKRYKEFLKKEDILFFKLNKIERYLLLYKKKSNKKIKAKEWYLKNIKKIHKQQAEYRYTHREEIREKANKRYKDFKKLAKLGNQDAIDKLNKYKLNHKISYKRWYNSILEKSNQGDEHSLQVLENIKNCVLKGYKRRWNDYRNKLKNNDKDACIKYKRINETRKQWRIKNKEKVLKQKLEAQKKAHKGLKDNIYLFFNKINKSFNEKHFRKDFQDFLTYLSNKIMNKNIDEIDKKNLSVLRNSIINVYMFNFVKKYLFLGDLKPITYEIKESEK